METLDTANDDARAQHVKHPRSSSMDSGYIIQRGYITPAENVSGGEKCHASPVHAHPLPAPIASPAGRKQSSPNNQAFILLLLSCFLVGQVPLVAVLLKIARQFSPEKHFFQHRSPALMATSRKSQTKSPYFYLPTIHDDSVQKTTPHSAAQHSREPDCALP
jgi:hypothetical protein